MPWPWELCLHCMDLRSGTVLNWPLSGDWLANAPVVEAMRTTWHGWLFHKNTTDPKHVIWATWEVDYEDWLQDGRPQLPTAPSAAEQWAIEQGYSE